MPNSGIIGLIATGMLGVALVGCAGDPAPDVPIYQLEVRGDSPADARHQAMRQAREQCGKRLPVVLDSNTLHTEPTFTSVSETPSSQSEVADYAATTHEGESPLVRWRYRCQ